jgi:predicted nucleic acid-binding protein
VLALTGFDSGVFVLLANGHPDAVRLWEETASGKRRSLVSALSLFEIYRLGLKGVVPLPFAENALRSIPKVCEVIWINEVDLVRTGARLSQGMALSMADALILSSLADCREIYTTDTDLARYRKSSLEITILKPA